MKTISELKRDLVFNREMNELMDILKKTAVFEFQSLFNRRRMQTIQEKYVSALEGLMKIFPQDARHPFLTNSTDKVVLVLLTSDMGFVGGLNTEVVDLGLKALKKKDDAHLLVLGEKGYLQLEESGHKFDFLPGIGAEMDFALSEKVRDYIYASCWQHKVGRVIVSYPKFISFARQEIVMETLIPCGYLFQDGQQNTAAVAGPNLPASRPAEIGLPDNRRPAAQFIFEPSAPTVLDRLLRLYLAYKIQDVFWQAKLSEFAARSMHLDGSMQELIEMKKGIQSQYFRSKHEMTDRTIRDIFGGRLATMRKLKL